MEAEFRVTFKLCTSETGPMIVLMGTDCKSVCEVPDTVAGRTVLREQLALVFDRELDRVIRGHRAGLLSTLEWSAK